MYRFAILSIYTFYTTAREKKEGGLLQIVVALGTLQYPSLGRSCHLISLYRAEIEQRYFCVYYRISREPAVEIKHFLFFFFYIYLRITAK